MAQHETQAEVRMLTINECVDKLRSRGMKINETSLTLGIEQGVFPFGEIIQAKRRIFIIFERLVDDWLDARTVKS